MHSRFAGRIEEGLDSLARRIAKSKRALDRDVLERQIGRLLQENSRAAGRYSIWITEDDTAPAALRLKWSACPEWDDWAAVSEGTYILRSNIHNWSDGELWNTYVQLERSRGGLPHSEV